MHTEQLTLRRAARWALGDEDLDLVAERETFTEARAAWGRVINQHADEYRNAVTLGVLTAPGVRADDLRLAEIDRQFPGEHESGPSGPQRLPVRAIVAVHLQYDTASQAGKMAASKTATLTLRIDPVLKMALRAISEREHRSLANMIEVMIRKYCANAGVKIPSQSKPVKGGDDGETKA